MADSTGNAEAVLETPRLRLEPLRRSHASELFTLLADPRLYRYVPGEPPSGAAHLAETFEILERRESPDGSERWMNWAVRSKSTGDCVGKVQATIRIDGSAYLAYEIGVTYWSQGFATEACQRILKALVDDFRAPFVVAEVDSRNVPSIRLLERLGFTQNGCRESADFFKGEPSHEFTYQFTPKASAVSGA